MCFYLMKWPCLHNYWFWESDRSCWTVLEQFRSQHGAEGRQFVRSIQTPGRHNVGGSCYPLKPHMGKYGRSGSCTISIRPAISSKTSIKGSINVLLFNSSPKEPTCSLKSLTYLKWQVTLACWLWTSRFKWTSKYYLTSVVSKAPCLMCQERVSRYLRNTTSTSFHKACQLCHELVGNESLPPMVNLEVGKGPNLWPLTDFI